MMLTGKSIIERIPNPTEEQIRWEISGQLCRCTGYQNIVKAIQAAAEQVRAESQTTPRSRGGIVSEVDINKEVRGLGHSVKRAEDARFIEGPRQLPRRHQAPADAPHGHRAAQQVAHGKIIKVDTEDAAAVPGVVAVVTGKDLEAHNLAWMPTLSGDTQAVLATDAIRFQGQEVAAAVIEDPYIAADAAEMVLRRGRGPARARRSLQGARSLGPHHPDRQGRQERQRRLHLGVWGCAEATDAAFASADRVVELKTHYPRCHPGSA